MAGDYDSEIKDFSSVLSGVFNNLSVQDAQKANEIFSVWCKVLRGIKSSTNPNEGANLASHSRVVDFKNGVLFIEADHPGWIELLQLRKNFILRGLSMYAKDMKVETLAFRLAGKRGNVTGAEYSGEEARSLAEQRAEREETATQSALNKSSPGNARPQTGKKEIAPELKAALDALKHDMGA